MAVICLPDLLVHQLPVTFVMCRPTELVYQLGCHWTDFFKIWKLCEKKFLDKIQIWFKTSKYIWHFTHKDPSRFCSRRHQIAMRELSSNKWYQALEDTDDGI